MLTEKTINQLSLGLRNSEFTVADLVEECYANIEKYNAQINAFITIIPKEVALEKAREAQSKLKSSKHQLLGIPFILKDAYITEDIRTTAASKVLDNFIPTYNATVYRKLLDSGSILLGKMNMDAWGHGGTTENTDYQPTRNPWDMDRVAGGSSGGPAAAIAARMAIYAIGEDTGGSIRNPAAWCNITGLKVTYGRVSRYGSIAYASSFDTVGPMAKSAEDCAVVLETIAGHDPYDATSSAKTVPAYFEKAHGDISGIVIGVPKEFFRKGLDPQIKVAVLNVARELEKEGAKIKEVSMPLFDYGIPVYYLIGPSETSSNLGRYDGLRYGNDRDYFTDETKRRILMGTYALSAGYYDAYYKKAQKARTLFIKEYNDIFTKCDVILQPINPTPPPKLGELIKSPLQNLLADIYTTSQNPVGVPSLAIPCGFTEESLPIGAQLVGKMFSEDLLLKIGFRYQATHGWHSIKPPILENEQYEKQ